MALEWVGTGGFVAGAGAISVTAPSGSQGDLILLFVNTANQAPPSTPTLDGVAMTVVDSIGTGTAGAAGATAIYCYRAVRGTSDFAAAVGDSGSYQTGVMIYLRGQHATTPLGTPVTRVDASSTLTVTWPDPGTPSSGQWVVQAIGLDQDANNAALDVFGPTPSFLGYVRNGVIGDTTFDTGAITNAGAGGGLWIGVFNSNYSLSGGNYSASTTHAQIAFIVDVVAAESGTLTTTTGSAAAAGGTGSMTGGTDATLSTTTGASAAAGETGSLTGDATLSTTTGAAAAAGLEGALLAATDATLTTTTGGATAAGGTGAMVLGTSATASTATGDCWVNPTNATGAPNDTYATWTTDVDAATSCELVVGGFGTWAEIPAGSTIESVEIRVQHHESDAGAPLEFVSAQAYLGATPLGTATNLTLSLTDRDDVITPSLTLADLQGNTLAVRIIGDRV